MEGIIELSKQNSLLNSYLAEMRSETLQKDAHRFRENLSSIGVLMAYEISKQFNYSTKKVTTPLGDAPISLVADEIVVAGILRAALPFQMGMLSALRNAESAFISAYRKALSETHFEIVTEYEAKPILENKTLIIADPMCATGQSLLACYNKLTKESKPKRVIFASIFASMFGIETLLTSLPHIVHYTCVVDKELNAKSYIVPGLGDAGDLAFGIKT